MLQRSLHVAMSWISTHALTWSATNGEVICCIPDEDFNSRTHVECDISAGWALAKMQEDFNSRTHVECD